MKRQFSLFTYPVMDMKAAEAELNRRAAAGWRLERLWLGMLASFVSAESPVCYCINWADPEQGDGADYEALLAEAGWRRRALMTYQEIYEAPAGTTPIQTDSALEYRRFRRKVLRRMCLGSWMWALLLAAWLLALGLRGWDMERAAFDAMATSAAVLAVLYLAPLLLAGGGAWLLRMGLRLRQWRRAADCGEPLPVPGRRSAAAACLAALAGWLCGGLLLLAALLDAATHAFQPMGIVLLIVGAGSLLRMDRPEMGPVRRRGAWFLAVLAAAVFLPLVPGLGEGLRPADPLAAGGLAPGLTEPDACETGGTVLLSHTRLEETGPRADGTLTGTLRGEAWTARSPETAEWIAGLQREPGMEPLDGYENVWVRREVGVHTRCAEEAWLICGGNTAVRVRTDLGPLDEAWLDNMLARLEEGVVS